MDMYSDETVLHPRIKRIYLKQGKQAGKFTTPTQSESHATFQNASSSSVVFDEDEMKIGGHDYTHQETIAESISAPAGPSGIHVNNTAASDSSLLQTISFGSCHMPPSTSNSPPAIVPVPNYVPLPRASALTSSPTLFINMTENTAGGFDALFYRKEGLTPRERSRYDVMANHPWIAKFNEYEVVCRGCALTLQMEEDGKYYMGNFKKHGRNCPGIHSGVVKIPKVPH
ncbi:hypothetical protein K435DRAFT_871934 [Dendrothele bispora CBS 962.96]|uniref:Uncharacterized protein n=1 Tax=Dendrothele bispora (strain CBS 962.96) TaxID=1314807 RepID=A0A4S8L483_DENBC|nr:hypothetical protein K435DRAFT_871934 [Dendrothele bispora CBS 962.96]